MPKWGASVAFGTYSRRNPQRIPSPFNPPPPRRCSEDDADAGLGSRFLGRGNAVAGPGCQDDTEQTLFPFEQGPGPNPGKPGLILCV